MNALASIPSLGKELGGVFYLHGEDYFRKDQTLRALVRDPRARLCVGRSVLDQPANAGGDPLGSSGSTL